MIKSIKKIRLAAFIIFGIEVVLIAGAVLIYIYNLFKLRPYFTIQTTLIFMSVIVLINLIVVFAAIGRIHKLRLKSDLLATEILGNDVKEAYNFGMIGLLVIDDKQTIIWASELFTNRQMSIIDHNILDWQPELARLINAEQTDKPDEDITIKLEIDARNYEVKYLHDALLFIFKDITDNEFLFQANIDQSPVVGIVMIDNYTDITMTREDNNPTTARIKSAIFDYGRSYGFLVRMYREDAFLYVGNHKSFETMIADKFSLLAKVRGLSTEEHQEGTLTLSIGIAYDFPDIIKLHEMALDAADFAMTRGGDQAVVSRHGFDYESYGGVAVASEKRNKSKVRFTSETLSNLIKNAGNVIVMGHTWSDLDAVGSALGVKALADHIKKRDCEANNKPFIPAVVVYDQKATEKKTKSAVTHTFTREEQREIFVSAEEVLNDRNTNATLKSNTLLIVVDVSVPRNVISKEILDRANSIAIIDHHRRVEDFIEKPVFTYIEPSSSSTSELVTELFEYGNYIDFELPVKFATFMLSGIFLDTNYFRSNTTGMRTFEACMILKNHGADNGLADDFLKDEYEEYALTTKIMSTLKTLEFGIVAAYADSDYLIDSATLAKVANQAIQIKGVNASFVIGKSSQSEVRISARSDGSVNVQILMEKLGGGGHQAAAAGAFSAEAIELLEKRYIAKPDVKANLVTRLLAVLQIVISTFLNEVRISDKK